MALGNLRISRNPPKLKVKTKKKLQRNTSILEQSLGRVALVPAERAGQKSDPSFIYTWYHFFLSFISKRGAILNRTYVTNKYLYIYLDLVKMFGRIYYAPPQKRFHLL